MSNDFASLGLSAHLVERARTVGFDAPTRLQAAAIPILRRGGNAVVRGSAGSGVTAAVLLALLDRLGPEGPASGTPGRPRALIVTVTEERAADIARTAARLASGSGLRVSALSTEWSAPGDEPIVAASADAVVTGVGESTLKLDGLEVLVLDRVDALLEIADPEVFTTITAAIPSSAQRVIVTGAMTRAVERLIEGHARKAITVPAQPADPALAPAPAQSGTLSYLVASAGEKPAALARLLRRPREEAPSIATRSAARAEQVRTDLELRGFDVTSEGGAAAHVVHGEETGGARIAYDVPFDAASLAALDLEHGIVLVEPTELPHLRSIAAEAGVTLTAVGGARAVRGTVATYREGIRRAIEQEDLDAQLALLDPLFDQYSAPEVAAALSALLRRLPADSEAAKQAAAEAPQAFVRLFISLGQRDNIRPGDLVGAIAGEASIAGDQVGRIDIRDTFSVVEVAAADADRVIRALNGTTLRGRSLRVDYDRRGSTAAREKPARRRPHHRS